MQHLAHVEIVELKPAMKQWVERLVAWENDISIRHLISPSKSEDEFSSTVVSQKDIIQRIESFGNCDSTFLWGLLADNEPVGTMSSAIDVPIIHAPYPGTIWPGLVIGEAGSRRRGVGRQAMSWLEKFALEKGCRRIELGVFEYNEPSRALCAAMGYSEFARIPEFTWWKGKLWADIRMEKWL